MQSGEFIKLLRGATFVFCCRLTGAVLTFVSQVLLARWMGAEQMGVYVFAFSICALLTIISGLGFPAAAIRFVGASIGQQRGDLVLGFTRRAVQISALLGLAVALIGALGLSLGDGLIASDRRTTLLVAMLIVPVYGQQIARSAVALGLSWVPSALLPNTVFRPSLFLALIAGATFFSVPLSSERAMSLQFLAIVLVALVQWWVMRRHLHRQFPHTSPSYETPLWLRTAAPLLIITLFTNYFLELNVFLAGTYLEAADLAVFNAALRTTALIAFGFYAVDAITMPQISRQHAVKDSQAFRATVIRASRLRFWGSLCAAIPLIAIGRPILGLFGERFVDGYQSLVILAAAQVASAVLGPTARLLSVTGFQDKCLRVFVLSLIAMFALHPPLIKLYGINGAALSVFAVVMIQSIWLYLLVVRHLGIHAWAFAARPAAD